MILPGSTYPVASVAPAWLGCTALEGGSGHDFRLYLVPPPPVVAAANVVVRIGRPDLLGCSVTGSTSIVDAAVGVNYLGSAIVESSGYFDWCDWAGPCYLIGCPVVDETAVVAAVAASGRSRTLAGCTVVAAVVGFAAPDGS